MGACYHWYCRTPSPYKGLGGLHETCHEPSIVLEVSADSLLVIRLSGWGMVCGVLVLVLVWDDTF